MEIKVVLFVVLCGVVFCQQVRWVQTSKGNLDRLSEKAEITLSSTQSSGNIIQINAEQKYQSIFGFGGAFTEAAAMNFALLDSLLQEEILEAYFGTNGIGYSMGRVHMNSCDFCVYSYNFDNITGDYNLSNFDTNVTHDQHTMIPFIKRANETATAAGNPIWLFLTPWSPPAWMKIPVNGNQAMDGSATPNGLLRSLFPTWALYYTKFIKAYEDSGVHIWGLTVQNEPEFAAPWEACCYVASYESDFIASALGPQLKKEYPDIKIMGYDHNRDDIYNYASILYSNETTKDYLDGIAFHWYVGNELYNVNKTHWLDTERFVLATEGCNCPGVELGDWERAENYGRDIIADLNFYSVGWIDWNLVLNTIGGPNHLQNYCDAMIIADIEAQSIYFQPSFYYMGQISKYVPRNSIRIGTSAFVNFLTPSGQQPNVENGYNVIISECNGAPNQLWNLNSNSEIILENSSMCLDIENWDLNNGANVQTYDCGDNQANQNWSWDSTTKQISSSLNNKCLDVLDWSTQSGANIQMWDCHDGYNQQWNLESDGTIRNLGNSNLCLTSGWSAFQHVAFKNPEGNTVLIVMNSSDNELSFSVENSEYKGLYLNNHIPGHSIQTYIY